MKTSPAVLRSGLRALLPITALSIANLAYADTKSVIVTDSLGVHNQLNQFADPKDAYIGDKSGGGYPDGIYFFGVTQSNANAPSTATGTLLLSNDRVANGGGDAAPLYSPSALNTPTVPSGDPSDPWGWKSRAISVVGGKIAGVVNLGSLTSNTVTNPSSPSVHKVVTNGAGEKRVQLWPYALTPLTNNSYKVWFIHYGSVTLDVSSAINGWNHLLVNAQAALSGPLPPDLIINGAGYSDSDANKNEYTISSTPATLTLACPANFSQSVECPGTSKCISLPPATATNAVGAFVVTSVTFSNPSVVACDGGYLFPLGTTTVTVTGHDQTPTTATCSFTVTLNQVDTTAPLISAPTSVAAFTSANSCDAVVEFTVSATDCSAYTVTASPASGSTFPKGDTTVTVTAVDAFLNTSSTTFVVTVTDNVPPTITAPPTVSVQAAGCDAAVSFNATITDNCNDPQAPTVVTSIITASTTNALVGTTFLNGQNLPIGTHTVTITATDGSGNPATATVVITVLPPTGTITVKKFYDMNGDGIKQATEPWIQGFKIQIGSSTQYTDANGTATFTGLALGSQTVTEIAPAGAGWTSTTGSTSQTVTLTCSAFTKTVTFGNLRLGGGGGLSLGFWSSKNGATVFAQVTSPTNLALLTSLNLKYANGTDFDPASYSQVSTFLLGATATNMASMLSAQLAAVELDVNNSGTATATKFLLNLSASQVVAVGTAPVTGAVNGYATVQQVMDTANTMLGANGLTTTASTDRTNQEAVKNVLNGICNGTGSTIYVQPPPSGPLPLY